MCDNHLLILYYSDLLLLQRQRRWTSLQHPGRYGNPPSLRIWFLQLIEWMGILMVMKIIVGVSIYVFRTPLSIIGSLLFYPVRTHPKVELLIVMIGCPLVMNMVQFWIQDSFLKDHNIVPYPEGRPLLSPTKHPGKNKSRATDMYDDL